MFAIVIVTMLAHILTVSKGISFFLEGDLRRDAEKHIVACIVAGSIIFIMFQAWLLVDKTGLVMRSEDIYSPWLAYNFFTSVLHLCLATTLTKQRTERAPAKS